MLLFLPERLELPHVLDVALVEVALLTRQQAIALGLEIAQFGRVPRHKTLDLGLKTAHCQERIRNNI